MLNDFLKWAQGGSEYTYHILLHCFDGDVVWSIAMVVACSLVVSAYALIAFGWFRDSRLAKGHNMRLDLLALMFIFIFCAASGYLFKVADYWINLGRLEVVSTGILAVISWAYAIRSKSRRTVFHLMQKETELLQDNQALREQLDAYGRMFGENG